MIEPLPSAAPPTLADYQHRLVAQYGPLIGGPDLVRALGYRTQAAFDKARQEERLPMRTFSIEGRRGRFAATDEFARWLWTQQFGDPGR
jgi:hypothetical protein